MYPFTCGFWCVKPCYIIILMISSFLICLHEISWGTSTRKYNILLNWNSNKFNLCVCVTFLSSFIKIKFLDRCFFGSVIRDTLIKRHFGCHCYQECLYFWDLKLHNLFNIHIFHSLTSYSADVVILSCLQFFCFSRNKSTHLWFHLPSYWVNSLSTILKIYPQNYSPLSFTYMAIINSLIRTF